MYLAVQPSLIERTVFEMARRDETMRPLYERQFSQCYEQRDPTSRDQAFADLHERWFDETGLRKRILALIDEFTHIRGAVSRLMVTQASGPRAQTAELFGSPGKYTVVISIAPSTLLDRSAFEYWARHEFLHIDDMLTPDFGYDIARKPAGATSAARNLAQDRYAVLWALFVDGRLAHRGHAPASVEAKRRAELARAFGIPTDDLTDLAFGELWRQSATTLPNHRTLLDWAENGLPQLRHVEADLHHVSTPTPGYACSLCGFPTFDWAIVQSDDESLHAAIKEDFPVWKANEPICTRCSEIYSACAAAAATSARLPS
jgi:hypothetical protein